MGTRKNIKSKKSNKRFRKNRSKRQRGGGDQEDKLLEAVKNNKLAEVIEALAAGIDVNITNTNGETALDFAIYDEDENPEIVALLRAPPCMSQTAPPCMSQTEYEKCKIPEDEKEIVKCPLTLEELDIKDAVKLPNQPNTCYDRKTLKHQFTIKKINPVTNEVLENEDWINTNLVIIAPPGPVCKPQTESAPSRGGKKRKSRRSKKSKRKTRKTRKIKIKIKIKIKNQSFAKK
jgi:hypothetical protein